MKGTQRNCSSHAHAFHIVTKYISSPKKPCSVRRRGLLQLSSSSNINLTLIHIYNLINAIRAPSEDRSRHRGCHVILAVQAPCRQRLSCRIPLTVAAASSVAESVTVQGRSAPARSGRRQTNQCSHCCAMMMTSVTCQCRRGDDDCS